MALTSLMLVLTEHRRAETRQAGLTYAVMTQLGFLAIVLALVIFAAAAGTELFAGMGRRRRRRCPRHTGGHLPAVVRGVRLEGRAAAAARLAGPRASGGAEPGVSAAERRHGQHGHLRGAARRRRAARSRAALVGSGPRAGRGGVRRLRVLQASVANDLKRLLAYSTSENMGLIVHRDRRRHAALGGARPSGGAGGDDRGAPARGRPRGVQDAGFLSAGSVLAATGLRDLDRLGGLARRMPATTVAVRHRRARRVGPAVRRRFRQRVAAAASPSSTRLPADSMMLALACRSRSARSRSPPGSASPRWSRRSASASSPDRVATSAAGAHEVAPTMLAGCAIAAAGCVVLAVAPAILSRTLRTVLAGFRRPPGSSHRGSGRCSAFPASPVRSSPALLAAALAVASLLAVAGTAGEPGAGRAATGAAVGVRRPTS